MVARALTPPPHTCTHKRQNTIIILTSNLGAADLQVAAVHTAATGPVDKKAKTDGAASSEEEETTAIDPAVREKVKGVLLDVWGGRLV